jgi:hypothetical protein
VKHPTLYTHTCNRCGNVWGARKLDPKRCPRSPRQDGTITGCGSPYWNKPRVHGKRKRR